MHELSVALEICRIAEERLPPGQAGNLVEVGVEVGDNAGLEVGNLEFCLGALLSNPPFGAARPVVRRTAGDALRVEYLEFDDGCPDD